MEVDGSDDLPLKIRVVSRFQVKSIGFVYVLLSVSVKWP